MTKNGFLNKQPNLDGFISEQHHANTFNIKVATLDKSFRAEVLKPKVGTTYAKNSIDLVIRNSEGKTLSRYQVKYGKDAVSTDTLFKHGDYRGQRKLVPQGQSQSIKGSTDKIQYDGVTSDPLLKKQAKQLQQQAQKKGKAQEYNWNDINKQQLVKNMGKEIGLASLLSTAYHGVRVFGTRLVKSVKGEENKSFSEDFKEFLSSASKSSLTSGIYISASGTAIVAIRKGFLGEA